MPYFIQYKHGTKTKLVNGVPQTTTFQAWTLDAPDNTDKDHPNKYGGNQVIVNGATVMTDTPGHFYAPLTQRTEWVAARVPGTNNTEIKLVKTIQQTFLGSANHQADVAAQLKFDYYLQTYLVKFRGAKYMPMVHFPLHFEVVAKAGGFDVNIITPPAANNGVDPNVWNL